MHIFLHLVLQDLLKMDGIKSEDEIKNKIDSIYAELVTKYDERFETNYIELEYSAKLVPDGKRCRMRKPYFKNILFIGDAAGRGIFIGPRIEGLNVGIDDAVRASESISYAIDNNNFSHVIWANFIARSIEESPYTADMEKIDKNYIKTFIDCTRRRSERYFGSRYEIIFKLMSNGIFRGIAVGFANTLGYNRLLPLVESEETYIQIQLKLQIKWVIMFFHISLRFLQLLIA